MQFFLAFLLLTAPAAAPKPAQLTELQAARFDAALGHVRDAQRAMRDAQEAFERARGEAAAVLKSAGLSLEDYASGRIVIDLRTGKVTTGEKK